MSTSSVVIGLLGGGVVGTAATGFLAASYQRAERVRERLVDTADEMLEAAQYAAQMLATHRRRTSELFRATAAVRNAQEALRSATEALSEAEQTQVTPALQRVSSELPNFTEVTTGAFDERLDAETLGQVSLAIANARRKLGEEVANLTPALTTALTVSLNAWRDYVPAASEQRGAWREWSDAYGKVGTRLTRVILLFTFRNRAGAVEAATELSGALGVAAQTFHTEQEAGRDPNFGNQAADQANLAIGIAIGNFARAAGAEIRRWWL